MNDSDRFSALLQNVISLLYGIAWLILGGFLCLGGLLLMLADYAAIAFLLLFPGVILCVAGILYARYGGQTLREKSESPNE